MTFGDAAIGGYIFQSTLSVRRATRSNIAVHGDGTDFNPRSP